MASTERAVDLFHKVAHTVENFRGSSFYTEHPELGEYEAGFAAMAKFLLDRPAMLIDDAQNKDKALLFIDKEWYEAEHAEQAEGRDELFAELGDMAFFVLLVGTIHWPDLNREERDFVERAIDWSQNKASKNQIDLGAAIVYVATTKDPVNYREEFYQLKDEESVDEARGRVVQIGKLHRKIRDQLNGHWKGSGNLLGTLAEQWYLGNAEIDTEVMQIEALFELAGIDMLSHLEI
jgi:hypothetical protein